MKKRNYEAEITQALKEKPRDGSTLREDLHIGDSKMYGILTGMEDKGLIRWDGEEKLWRPCGSS